ncbi:MAG: heavy-metal-associated domain-containing protein, partial [Bacteroidales bacterium]|nr:heavy-metal-associated domain-containing protein [Bacteroidales bacterium]
MKVNVLKSVCVVLVMMIATAANAQTPTKWSEVVIQTNGTCQACKNKIESNIAYEKGVKTVSYDLATAKVKIVYNAEKTSPDNLCKAINKLGYTTNAASASQGKSC